MPLDPGTPPPRPRPFPSERTREAREARRQDQIPTAELPLVAPVAPLGAPGSPPTPLPLRPPCSPHDTPSTPLPARREQTTPFHAVLATPGQQTTFVGGTPPPKGLETTAGFGVVLPLPDSAAEASTPAPELAPGTTLEDFVLGEELERRADAVVYRASHRVHGVCRLEVATPDGAPHAHVRLLDARLRTTLSDPRLQAVLALGSTPRPWVATALRQEPGLRQQRRALDALQLAHALQEVAEALHHAHERRVVHGDLSPDDVLLAGGSVCVVGFGRPTSCVGSDGARRAFPGGPPLGPAVYAAPERFEREEVSPAVDIYSLGAILYEGLVGRPPFQGTPGEVRRGALDRAPSLPGAADGSLRANLLDVAARCLAKRPEARFASARALAVALQEAQRVPTAHAEPADLAPRLAIGLLVIALLFLAATAVLMASR